MKTLLARAATLLGLALLLAAAHHLLAPMGLGWIVWTIAGLVGAFLVLELALSSRRRAGERAQRARVKAALTDPRARRDAIRELRRELDRARRLGRRTRVRQARLATSLAELLLAAGDDEEAITTLAKVPVEELEPLQAAVVRLARGQAYLHRGDAEGAAATLGPLGEGAGDPVIDASLALLRGAVDHLEGRSEDAARAARDVLARAEPHDELWDEARALLAMAEDDPSALDEVRPAGRARLAALAPPAVRALLAPSTVTERDG